MAQCLPTCSPLLAASVCPVTNFRSIRKTSSLSVGCSHCELPFVEASELWLQLLGAPRSAITASTATGPMSSITASTAATGPLSSWLLFVGDSDTRVLVFELLQLLVTGARGADAAKADAVAWLGFNTSNASMAERTDWLRRCLLDFVYSRDGVLVWQQSAHCNSAVMGDYEGKPFGKQPYIELGRDYNLSSVADMYAQSTQEAGENSRAYGLGVEGGVRVTFVGVNYFNQTMRTLEGLARNLRNVPEQPTALYVGVGSWFHSEGDDFAAELLTSLHRLARVVPPPARLTYGRILGMSNRYIQFVRDLPRSPSFRDLLSHSISRLAAHHAGPAHAAAARGTPAVADLRAAYKSHSGPKPSNPKCAFAWHVYDVWSRAPDCQLRGCAASGSERGILHRAARQHTDVLRANSHGAL